MGKVGGGGHILKSGGRWRTYSKVAPINITNRQNYNENKLLT